MRLKLDPSQIPFLLAFHRHIRLTHARAQNLNDYFQGDFEKAWKSSLLELQKAGLDHKGLKKWELSHTHISPQKEFEDLQTKNIQILLRGQKDYPLSLDHMHDPPPILFMKGNLCPQDFPNLGVVGSRKITHYGKRALEHLIKPIIQSGVTITSGLAFGTDFLAHRTAVENGGRTIGVLGSSLDHIYPNAHQKWAEKNLEEGRLVLLSESLPHTPLLPEHFPIRNRIIAALSKCLVIIEGTTKSGSLITARLANDQGKEVFALPGDIFSCQSQGPNQLILEGGAHPLISTEQLIEYLGLKPSNSAQSAQSEIPSCGIEADILACFEGSNIYHIDAIKRTTHVPQHQLTSTLILLEMKGLVKNIGGQQYLKTL